MTEELATEKSPEGTWRKSDLIFIMSVLLLLLFKKNKTTGHHGSAGPTKTVQLSRCLSLHESGGDDQFCVKPD